MKITDVKAYPLYARSEERVTGYLTGYDDVSSRLAKGFRAVYVKIETDQRIHGWGESIVRESGRVSAEIINGLMRSYLVGQDPLESEVLFEKLLSMLRIRGHSYGFFMEALSGVDMALWDIKGKYFRCPVYRLLGGKFSDSVPVYLSSIVFKDKDSAAKEALRWVDKGFTDIKIKIGQGYERDLEVVKEIRNAVGYGITLRVDANTAYNPTSAIRVGRMLEKYEIAWLEEPIKPDNLRGYKALAAALDIPLCAAETFFSRYQWKEYFAEDAIDIAQPDIARVGGISEALKIIAMAGAFERPVSFHVGLSGLGARASALQLYSIIPENMALPYEYYYFNNPLVSDLATENIEEFQGNRIRIPERNGLGFDIEESKIEKYLEQ